LTKDTEKYVNGNSFIGNLSVLIYTYASLLLLKDEKKKKKERTKAGVI